MDAEEEGEDEYEEEDVDVEEVTWPCMIEDKRLKDLL